MHAKQLFLCSGSEKVSVIGIDHQLTVPVEHRLILKLVYPDHPDQKTENICD
jgi:hypothetical protein